MNPGLLQLEDDSAAPSDDDVTTASDSDPAATMPAIPPVPHSTFHTPQFSASLTSAETDFYEHYAWCLNPFPTVRETIEHLRRELDQLRTPQSGLDSQWQTREVMTNVYLLSCALQNAIDDFLRGDTLRLPGRLMQIPLVRGARWLVEQWWAVSRQPGRSRCRRWQQRCQSPFAEFLSIFISQDLPTRRLIAGVADRLVARLQSPLPADLLGERIYFPSAFRRLDLTHFDILELGRRFVNRFPDRGQPLLLLGLRTAGSYFAPLLQAYLLEQGYQSVSTQTIHTLKSPGPSERATLVRCAHGGCRVIILDDPPHTGDTIVQAIHTARRAGFPGDKIVVLVPTHPARRDWSTLLSQSETVILSLEPEAWHKQLLMDPKVVESRLAEYFGMRNLAVRAVPFRFGHSSGSRSARLKCLYEVRLLSREGRAETRYVLAKSVGWGWLGYHAFLAGQRLAKFVPPMLGLRDGIVYSEWIGQGNGAVSAPGLAVSGSPCLPVSLSRCLPLSSSTSLQTVASYIAARARFLSLERTDTTGLGMHRHHDGFRLLEKVLTRMYGRFLTATLMRPTMRRRLALQSCPSPTLIDARMEASEWIVRPATVGRIAINPSNELLKADYEHHGLGKNELNIIDPAYDLADAVLQLKLSQEDEHRLIQRYVEESSDIGVHRRLFQNKFLAGHWSMASALNLLCGDGDAHSSTSHEDFLAALHFLTVQSARFCGSLCPPPQPPRWRSPMAVLDVDGVLDRWLYSFPTTTVAGIKALALLHNHDFAITVNTARSLAEVREYCQAYGFAGGVAEYGSYLWDAVQGRGKCLLSREAASQLGMARTALEKLPGVFLDHRYQYSIRAFTYESSKNSLGRAALPGPLHSIVALGSDEKGPVPLPTLTAQLLIEQLGLNLLAVKQTTLDTTIVAKEVNKGSGLTALLSWVGQEKADTAAVGDSESDLPMFRAARRSFAPCNIGCAAKARLIGCRIVRQPYQRGLLSIARTLVHADGKHCDRCRRNSLSELDEHGLISEIFRAPDGSRLVALFRALLDPMAYRVFVR